MALVQKEIANSGWRVTYLFDDEKPFMEQDLALEAAWEICVAKEAALSMTMQTTSDQYESISEEIKTLRSMLQLIEELSLDARNEADECWEAMLVSEDYSLAGIAEKVAITNKSIDEYHEKLLMLSPKVVELSEILDNFIELSEDESSYKKFTKIKQQHSKNYPLNSIDVRSFDAAIEVSRSYMQHEKVKQNRLFRFLNDYVDDSNTLMLETEMEYAVWTEFGKRVEILNKILRQKIRPLGIEDVNLN